MASIKEEGDKLVQFSFTEDRRWPRGLAWGEGGVVSVFLFLIWQS